MSTRSMLNTIEENPNGKYMILVGYYDFHHLRNDWFDLDFDPRDFKSFATDLDKAYSVFNYLIDREVTLMDKYHKYWNRYTWIKIYYGKSWVDKWENTNGRYKDFKGYYTQR